MSISVVAMSPRPSILYIRNTLGSGLVGCEIGVDKGENSCFMLQVLEPRMVFLIDPWFCFLDLDSGEIIGETQYQMTLRKLAQFPNKTILRETSEQASKRFKDGELDFVYIDGDHRFQGVFNDINLWYPKVRKGGVLAGHDYDATVPGVIGAVKMFVNRYQLHFTVQCQDWWIQK